MGVNVYVGVKVGVEVRVAVGLGVNVLVAVDVGVASRFETSDNPAQDKMVNPKIAVKMINGRMVFVRFMIPRR